MIRKMLLTASAAALVFAGVGIAAPSAFAGAPPINGVGHVGTCNDTGSIKLKPALTNAGSGPGTVKVAEKSSGGPCSGASGDGAHVISSSAKGGENTTTSACTSLLGTAHNTLTLTVKWKTDGTEKLNSSTITITSETGGTGGTGGAYGTFDVSGTVTAGSFNGNAVTAHVTTDQTITTLGAECGAKGIKSITFKGVGGPSTTTL